MRKIARFLIITILSGILFGFVFSNCVEFNIDSIFGSIYDHARPEVREEAVRHLEETCEKLELVAEYPNVEIEIEGNVDLEKIKELCQKNLSGRELFIEMLKTQTDNIRFPTAEGPGFNKYIELLNLPSENLLTTLIVSFVLLVLLFLVENNYLNFLKDIGKILLSTSLFLFFIYLLPKVIIYFVDVDTSFLLEMDQETQFLFSEELFLVLLPIILEVSIKDCMLWYSSVMIGVYVVITIFRHFKK